MLGMTCKLAVFSLFLILFLSPAYPYALLREGPSSSAGSGTEEYSLEKALDILNESDWARQQTVTQVVSGVGSGEYGEKEIFSRYYIRILSAPPIRKAYESIRKQMKQDHPDASLHGNLDLSAYDDSRFLVIGVAFRSNHPDLEGMVLNTFRSQTVETLQNRAYLSTTRFPQVRLAEYAAPSDPAIGAQFVFPRLIDGESVISPGDTSFAFELDLPGRRVPELRVTFPVTDAVVGNSSAIAGGTGATDSSSVFDIEALKPDRSASVDLDSSRFAGVVNLFPQTSARAFHGSLYWFHRNDNFDARNFFDPVGESLPEYKRNQFGFSLGAELGPRLNIFTSFDGLRINQGSTLLSNVPTPAMKAGDFSELLVLEDPVHLMDPFTGLPFPGNQIPADRIHPVTRNLLGLLPDPNRDESVRNFVNSQPVVSNVDTLNLRVDYGLSDRSQLSSQFQMVDGNGIDVHPFPHFGRRELEKEYEGYINFTRKFSDHSVSSFRMEFDRSEELDTTRDERPAGLLNSLGIEGIAISGPEDEGYPVFEVEGYPDFGDEQMPRHEVENRYRFEGEFTLTRGDHILELAGAIGWHQLNDVRSSSLERGAFSFSGAYSGHAFADFLLGRADQATRAGGSSRQDLRGGNFRLGITDEWRLLDRLTLTLGLRYQYYSPYYSIHNNLSVFRPLLFEPPKDGGLVDLNADSTGSEDRISTVVHPDRNDFAPRLGFAYRPFGSGRIVFRGSYSVGYEPLYPWIFMYFMGRNFPYYYQQQSQASTDSSGLDISTPFDTSTPTELAIRDIEPNLRSPYTHRWNITLQNELNDNWTLEFSYRGRRSLKNLRIIPANVPTPAPGEIQQRRPNPDYGQFSLVSGGGSSLYYEFQTNLRRRFANGFTFDTQIEFRRRFTDQFRDAPSNPRDLRSEWGPSEHFNDRVFRMNFIYDLPFGTGRPLGEVPFVNFLVGGWRLSGIARITSGDIFSVRLPGDFNNDGLSSDRPDRLGSGHLDSGERSIDRWFDTEAFAEPEAYTFGNSGRGILVGPPYHNWDMSLIKDFVFPNSHRMQFRFAFFNAFNHTNFNIPETVYGTQTFGVITSAGRAREIEIAMRYLF